MKKFILLQILIYFFPVIKGQQCFPDSNAIWNVTINNSSGDPIDEVYYGLVGDTLINDTLYNKLFILSDTTLMDKLYYLGGFRKDGLQVWFRPFYMATSDILIYDFSAFVGDTIWHNSYVRLITNSEKTHEFAGYEKYNIIHDITIEKNIKKYSLIPLFYPEEWYYGIGSNLGLFGPIMDYPLSGDTYKLSCFKQNDTVKYLDNSSCNKCFCNKISGGDTKEKKTCRLNIFPNPAKHSITLLVYEPYSSIWVEILDEKGTIIYQSDSLKNPFIFNESIQGIYFIKLTIDKEVITKKIIIN